MDGGRRQVLGEDFFEAPRRELVPLAEISFKGARLRFGASRLSNTSPGNGDVGVPSAADAVDRHSPIPLRYCSRSSGCTRRVRGARRFTGKPRSRRTVETDTFNLSATSAMVSSMCGLPPRPPEQAPRLE